MSRTRVLLADDHTMMAEGLRKLLEEEYELVGVVHDGKVLVDTAKQVDPEVVVLDITMPLLNGFEAARRIKAILPETIVVFLTMHTDPTYATEAFRAGASGYVVKQSAPAELLHAIEVCLKGEYYLTPSLTKHVLNPLLASSTKRPPIFRCLTERQREILQLVTEGHSAKEIAHHLHVSVKTVEFHKSKLMEQLGMHTTAELIKYAITQGLVYADPPLSKLS